VFYTALPWGSVAGDFLWNISTPSWSFVESAVLVPDPPRGDATYIYRDWTPRFVTKSFNSQFQTGGSSFGIHPITGSYAVTSSWIIIEPKLDNASVFTYLHSINSVPQYPQNITSLSDDIGYRVTYPSLTSYSTSSIDGAYFDQGGGAAISRTSIIKSLTTASVSGSDNTATGLRVMTQALKARRLYFPIHVSGSGTTRGTDYWFKKSTGYSANELFTDNGGIYNVKFSLKRKINLGYYPDTNTFMTAFIHNVLPQIPSSSARIPGADGWYPPANNIVTIGNQYNGGPEMSFVDIQTGYYVEKFNFNLIQYGYPAQMCLEVSGSLSDNAYFGIIVDEFEMCKVGVTTDARFIKPTSIAATIQEFQEQETGGGGFEEG